MLKYEICLYNTYTHNNLKITNSTKTNFIYQPITVVLSSPHPSYSKALFSNEDDTYSAKVRRRFLSFKVVESDADNLRQSVSDNRISSFWLNYRDMQLR